MKPVTMFLEMYGMQIEAYIGWCPNKTRLSVQKKYGVSIAFNESLGSCAMLHSGEGDNVIIIHTTTWKGTPGDYGVFAHETLHAALFCCEHIGQEVDTMSHEHLTYLHQYIFEILMAKRNAKPKAKKAKKKK